ncbi:MAG TPA: AAA family ATPase [Bryobacteraceae bacterium]|nr:AAA family ATPase [Bryobacteraceae bacterium]
MEAVILIGIQGAGKSTFYRERFFDTHVRINLDMLRTRARERAFVETCLRTRQRFVVDNTNARVAERAVYLEGAKRAAFRTLGYFLETTLADAPRRNARRAGRARIPAAGVGAALKRLERPKREEGFDELYLVTQNEAGAFVVRDWA